MSALALADDDCTRKRRHVTSNQRKPSCASAGAASRTCSAAQRGANRSGPMALRRALLAAALAAAAAEVNVSCQIFEETMICDNAAQGVVRGEIRTCSG